MELMEPLESRELLDLEDLKELLDLMEQLEPGESLVRWVCRKYLCNWTNGTSRRPR